MAPHVSDSGAQARVCDVATALLAVLQRMHALGVIHRDVKLENIFIGGLLDSSRAVHLPCNSRRVHRQEDVTPHYGVHLTTGYVVGHRLANHRFLTASRLAS